MKKLLFIVCLYLTSIFLTINDCQAQAWFYPLEDSQKRVLVKDFGILIDQKFYIGKENLFPYNRFYGYHAGVDLEVFPNEENIPIPFYAVSSGTITYTGPVNGYGGVVLEKLDDNQHLALYGHIKVSNLKYGVNEQVEAGQMIGYLGEEFSSDTAKERKHLHFAIHKGINNYFNGHEKTLLNLTKNWENPMEFLNLKQAQDLSNGKTEAGKESLGMQETINVNLWQRILQLIKILFFD